MRNFQVLLLLITFIVSGYAINPVKDNITNPKANESSLEVGLNTIDAELNDLLEIEKIVRESSSDYETLQKEYPELLAKSKISSSADSGLLDGAADVPLGIPGFWWGFCIGWVGLVIIYVSMDDGADRKQQVKNALIGCVISTVVWTIFYVAVIAAAST